MTEDEAYAKFKAVRFEENNGEAFCPSCGSCEVGEIKTRKIFKCLGCRKQFSVTSGTIFASRKLQFRDLLLAIAIFANGVKGHSALQLSRELGVQYKTAFVLLHKIREAIGIEQDVSGLTGEIEVDGAWYGSYVKKYNYHKQYKINKWAAKAAKGREKCMVVIRQIGGKTVPLVFKTEAAGVSEVMKRIDRSAIVHVDEATHWNRIEPYFKAVYRINHSECYSDGRACTNWVESFHSRPHRAMWGIHHHISGPYLLQYGREMAWREDNRKMGNGEQFEMMLRAVTHHPVSRMWKGYWQRRKADQR